MLPSRVMALPPVVSELSQNALDCLCNCGCPLQSALAQAYDIMTINARDVRNDLVVRVIVHDAPRIAFICLAIFQLEIRVLCTGNPNAVDFAVLLVAPVSAIR